MNGKISGVNKPNIMIENEKLTALRGSYREGLLSYILCPYIESTIEDEDKIYSIVSFNEMTKYQKEVKIKDVLMHRLSLKELDFKYRGEDQMEFRRMYIYLLYEYCNYTYKQIGEVLGGKGHATMLSARRYFLNMIETDKKLRSKFNAIKEAIGIE